MKAEEPGSRVPVVKYGMGVTEQDKFVQRHFKVAEEEQAIAAFRFAHMLRVVPGLMRAFAKPADAAPVPTYVPPAATVTEPVPAAPDDLRGSLGLT
jgi:hypothetical protein